MNKRYIFDMLQGKINRMCVDKTQKELDHSYSWTIKWVEELYKLRCKELKNEEN